MKKRLLSSLSFFIAILLFFSCIPTGTVAKAESEYDYVNMHVASMGEFSTVVQAVYSDKFFYRDNTVYHKDLSALTLALAMAGFTAPEFYTLPEEERHPGNSNIEKTYEELTFFNDSYYNYDKPLSDVSDKVAYSFAMKYITDDNGSVDTLVTALVRGANYGGEWASNFNIYQTSLSSRENHFGFQTSANEVYESLNAYLEEHSNQIKGELKIWTTGYSRGAAVSNLLSHLINYPKEEDFLRGIFKSDNLYSYAFACTRGAYDTGEVFENDKNIFAINSPSDLIPMIPFGEWGFVSYGNSINISDTLTEGARINYDILLQNTKYIGSTPCNEEQSELFSSIAILLSEIITERTYKKFLQSLIVNLLSNIYKEGDVSSITDTSSSETDVIATLSGYLLQYSSFNLEENINNIIHAHLPEHYLAILMDAAYENTPIKMITDDSEQEVILGDLDTDGKINLSDVVIIQKNVANITDFYDYQFERADVNKDETISVLDIIIIQKYIAKLIPEL